MTAAPAGRNAVSGPDPIARRVAGAAVIGASQAA